MGSSIKINSISIDLAGAANEIDMVKCDHFSIRGYVAETREKDHKKCWPFPEESVILVDQESYSLPFLSVPKSRWWRCMSCIRDINIADETKDRGLHLNSRSISGKKLNGNSSIILTQSKMNSPAIIDQEKERRTGDIAGNSVEANKEKNCKRSQKSDHRATTTVRNKVKKLASQEKVRNKRAKATDINSWKEKHSVGGQAVTTFGSSDIAGVVEDTPPKAIKNHKDSLALIECGDKGSSESINLAMTGLQRRKTRKVRRLSELLDQPETKASAGGGGSSDNIRKEESSSSLKKRGRKRKMLPENNYVRRKLITVGATTSDQDYSTSTDSGFERDVIKGRQKNRRFQVVDEFVPSVLPCETSQECVGKNDLLSKSDLSVPCPLSAQRTEKKLLSLSKKKKHKPVSDNGKSTLISFSSQYTPDSLNDRFAAEGYFRKPIPQVNDSRPVVSLHMPENDHVRRSRDAEANDRLGEFGSSSKPNTGGWLRPGVDAVVDFSGNNNKNTDRLSFQNFNLRNTSWSTEVADRSSVFQKDASGADRKGKTVMFQEHPKRQSHDRKENTPEDQNDDIPMEIVELLAKNQYERCLPDKEEDKQPSQETTHKSKNTLLIDLNETYDNGASQEDNNNNTSRPPKPFDSNARREDQQHIKSLDFFPISQPYVPSPFGIFLPTQENRASSNIRFSGHTCQWLGNVPTMSTQPPYRVLRPCNTCQSVPHQYREAAPMWATTSMRPPQCHHRTPISFDMDPSTKLGMLSQAPPPSNEINTWNLNFVATAAANGKQKCGSSTSEFSFGCKHGNNNRSVDAFSSESSIPALHLLSLMDPRVGPNSTPPSDHRQGNTKATKRHFPHVVSQQPKERVEIIQTGDSSKTAAYQTKLLPYDYHNKSFPMGPSPGTSSFSFQNAQPPWIQHQENKTKRKEPVYSSSDQGRFQLLGASDSMKLPLKFHVIDKEKKQNRKAESLRNNAAASAWPPKNSCGPIVCSVSRNPADFTIAEPGNVYMLTGESLKVRKRAIYKKKPSLSKQEALNQTKKPVLPVTENV